MISSAKRKQMEDLIIKIMSTLDRTGYNAEKYKTLYKSMSNEQFEKHMKTFLNNDEENFYLEFTPFEKSEPTLEDIKTAANILGVPLTEYLYMPFVNPDGEPIRSVSPVAVGYIHLKRQQQILSKKNAFVNTIEQRNMKTGQLAGSDRNGRITMMSLKLEIA